MNGLKNEVRIIGGIWRSRKIKFPTVQSLRPTPDRVRVTLFNWLSPYIEDARCLDLFAGSGVLGFEALSRGAREVVFVDQSKPVIQQLYISLKQLEDDRAVIIQNSAERYLKNSTEPFDIIFLDPPFYKGFINSIVQLLDERNLVKPKGIVAIKIESKVKDPLLLPNRWEIFKDQKIGQVRTVLCRVNV